MAQIALSSGSTSNGSSETHSEKHRKSVTPPVKASTASILGDSSAKPVDPIVSFVNKNGNGEVAEVMLKMDDSELQKTITALGVKRLAKVLKFLPNEMHATVHQLREGMARSISNARARANAGFTGNAGFRLHHPGAPR